jgi:hypothetical protein
MRGRRAPGLDGNFAFNRAFVVLYEFGLRWLAASHAGSEEPEPAAM